MKVIPISPSSPIWKALLSPPPSTLSAKKKGHPTAAVHAHVVLTRLDDGNPPPPEDPRAAGRRLQGKFRSNEALLGGVNLVRYDPPHHVGRPARLLYGDIVYALRRYVLLPLGLLALEEGLDGGGLGPAPWDTELSQPVEHDMHVTAQRLKSNGVGYPYWKPEVSIKLVCDDVSYPEDVVVRSGMEVVRVNAEDDISKAEKIHPSGYSYLPGLHVDEIGLTSEKYVPVNRTVTSLPLRVSFDRNDVLPQDDEDGGGGGVGLSGGGGLSPARWRLLSHFSKSLEAQRDMGFDDTDIDDLRRLIADTDVTLLGITMLASALHLLFEFLTFKNDVEFWRGNKDLTGLSVRALFMDLGSQAVVLLYLAEKGSSLLMTVPCFVGVLIAMWKCQRGAGFKFVKIVKRDENRKEKAAIWNRMLRLLFGEFLFFFLSLYSFLCYEMMI